MNHVVVLRFFAAYAHIQAASACTLVQVPIIEVVTPSGSFQQRFVLAVNDGRILGPTVGLGAGYAHPLGGECGIRNFGLHIGEGIRWC
jgi:hypothetical protein